MRRLRISAVMIQVMVILAACASIQDQWNTKTPDEQGRIVINGLQKQLDNALDLCIAYVKVHPELKERWQKEGVPAFDVANEAFKTAIIFKYAPAKIYGEVQPLLTKALALARGMGVKI